MTWLFGLLGLSGVASSIAKVLASLIEVVSPLLKGLSEFVVWLVKTLWEGFKDIVDNIATIITVLVLVGFSFGYSKFDTIKKEEVKCKQEIKVVEKKVYAKCKCAPKTVTKPEAGFPFNPFKW